MVVASPSIPETAFVAKDYDIIIVVQMSLSSYGLSRVLLRVPSNAVCCVQSRCGNVYLRRMSSSIEGINTHIVLGEVTAPYRGTAVLEPEVEGNLHLLAP
jgi:hypothetical protein